MFATTNGNDMNRLIKSMMEHPYKVVATIALGLIAVRWEALGLVLILVIFILWER